MSFILTTLVCFIDYLFKDVSTEHTFEDYYSDDVFEEDLEHINFRMMFFNINNIEISVNSLNNERGYKNKIVKRINKFIQYFENNYRVLVNNVNAYANYLLEYIKQNVSVSSYKEDIRYILSNTFISIKEEYNKQIMILNYYDIDIENIQKIISSLKNNLIELHKYHKEMFEQIKIEKEKELEEMRIREETKRREEIKRIEKLMDEQKRIEKILKKEEERKYTLEYVDIFDNFNTRNIFTFNNITKSGNLSVKNELSRSSSKIIITETESLSCSNGLSEITIFSKKKRKAVIIESESDDDDDNKLSYKYIKYCNINEQRNIIMILKNNINRKEMFNILVDAKYKLEFSNDNKESICNKEIDKYYGYKEMSDINIEDEIKNLYIDILDDNKKSLNEFINNLYLFRKKERYEYKKNKKEKDETYDHLLFCTPPNDFSKAIRRLKKHLICDNIINNFDEEMDLSHKVLVIHFSKQKHFNRKKTIYDINMIFIIKFIINNFLRHNSLVYIDYHDIGEALRKKKNEIR